MNSALDKLVRGELSRVGVKAQDQIDEHEDFTRVINVLSGGWDSFYRRDYETAATIAKQADDEVEKILDQQAHRLSR